MMFFDGERLTNVEKSDIALINSATLIESLSISEAEAVCEDPRLTKELIKYDILTEKSIVKLDRKAKLKGATMTAVYTIARRRKDPDFKKLVTLWRLEAQLEKKLVKKYQYEAQQKAKKALSTSGFSPSKPSVSKMGAGSSAVKSAIAKAKSQLATH